MAGIGDHDIIHFKVNTKLEQTRQIPRSIYKYNRANWNALKEELHTLLASDNINTLEEVNAEQLWSKFKNFIAQVVNKYIPRKLTKTRQVDKLKHQVDKKKRWAL